MSKTGTILSLILAFVSGYVDTAVFIHMGGLFVAHVTGNFVLLGATLAGAGMAGHEGSASLQLVAFPVFFISAVLAAILGGAVGMSRRTSTLLWLAAAIIGSVAAAALLGSHRDAWLAMLLVVAMGVLNAAHRMDSALGPPFTVMTGNVTAVAIEAAYLLRLAPREQGAPSATTARTMLLLVIAFAVGCVLGALAEPRLGFGAMALPAALLAVRMAV
jgi:uncharacterized membrane protein YoaK (UPF0700 family)